MSLWGVLNALLPELKGGSTAIASSHFAIGSFSMIIRWYLIGTGKADTGVRVKLKVDIRHTIQTVAQSYSPIDVTW